MSQEELERQEHQNTTDAEENSNPGVLDSENLNPEEPGKPELGLLELLQGILTPDHVTRLISFFERKQEGDTRSFIWELKQTLYLVGILSVVTIIGLFYMGQVGLNDRIPEILHLYLGLTAGYIFGRRQTSAEE